MKNFQEFLREDGGATSSTTSGDVEVEILDENTPKQRIKVVAEFEMKVKGKMKQENPDNTSQEISNAIMEVIEKELKKQIKSEFK